MLKPDNVYEATKGLVQKVYSEKSNEYFHDAFFMRWAFRLYDGSLIKHSPPILVMPREHYSKWGWVFLSSDFTTNSILVSESYIELRLFLFEVFLNLEYLKNWSDIIASVDFFVSKPIGLASSKLVLEALDIARMLTGGISLYLHDKESAVEKNVLAASQFYLYYSEKRIGKTFNVKFPNASVTSSLFNIEQQELMSNDPFSHHRYGARKTSVYNRRLRLSGIKTTFFGGFPVDYFQVKHSYNGVSAPRHHIEEVEAVVYIATQQGEQVVRGYGTLHHRHLSSFISYPDSRATRIDFFVPNSDPLYPKKHIYSIRLQPHPDLNIAYYLHPDLKPCPLTPLSEEQEYEATFPVASVSAPFREGNKLKVSEINNPFLFPVENTYQVGTGKILNEAAIVMNVSDRNYGIYPVFVFTDSGVFTMQGQTSEAVHASIQAPSYMEPPTSDVICQTPWGVAFVTKRGLMLINQHKTEYISPQLREKDNVQPLEGIPDPLVNYPLKPFSEYLQGIEMMLYNPYHDELIIVDKDSPYNYVYDFAARSFYLLTERIDMTVKNSFPDVYAIGNRELKDFSRTEHASTSVALVTRPIGFGTPDRKKLERALLRCELHNVNNGSVSDKAIIAMYHGNDAVNFEPARGLKLNQNGNYRDYDMGLFAREKFRGYLFVFAGTIDEASEIRYLEIETDKEYDNEKMR